MNREGGWGEDLAAAPGTAADRAMQTTALGGEPATRWSEIFADGCTY